MAQPAGTYPDGQFPLFGEVLHQWPNRCWLACLVTRESCGPARPLTSGPVIHSNQYVGRRKSAHPLILSGFGNQCPELPLR
jgi:hypothetical protein